MLKISKPTRSGFETIIATEHFKCAFITQSENYAFGCVREMKRHNRTDELFVLLSGNATLLIQEGEYIKEHPMVQGEVYNVTAGTWHYLAVSHDARLFVTESSDTNSTNTDTLILPNPYCLNL